MIEVKNLTFSYSKDKQALHGLDFTVEDGGFSAFWGRMAPGNPRPKKS